MEEDWNVNYVMTAQFYNNEGTPHPNKKWSGKFSAFAFDHDWFAESVCRGAGMSIAQTGVVYNWGEFGRKVTSDIEDMKREFFKFRKTEFRLNVVDGYIVFKVEKDAD